ncbi:MAG: hypothetical protein AB7F88_18470 [Pyrinomonadaceae bacterium]
MANNKYTNPQEAAMQNLIGQFLNARSANEFNRAATGPHLDQDSLAAFTEGSISEREAKPVVAHLVDCSFCRHVTAELIRLDMAFAETPAAIANAGTTEPRKVSEVLSGLLSRIFGTTDGAVFAHEEKEGSEKGQPENTDSEDPKDS